jgi:hypothetical protein
MDPALTKGVPESTTTKATVDKPPHNGEESDQSGGTNNDERDGNLNDEHPGLRPAAKREQ